MWDVSLYQPHRLQCSLVVSHTVHGGEAPVITQGRNKVSQTVPSHLVCAGEVAPLWLLWDKVDAAVGFSRTLRHTRYV